MKNQTVGLSLSPGTVYIIRAFLALNYLHTEAHIRLSSGTLKKEEFLSWGWGDKYDGCIEYKKNRLNGTEADSPQRPFPQDGIYTWDTPNTNESKIRYTEGPLDHAWMKERDHNYVFRLEREGKLDTVEPNLHTEVPTLFDEIMATREQAPFKKALQEVTDNSIEKINLAGIRILTQPTPRALNATEILQLLAALKNNLSVIHLDLSDVELSTATCVKLCEVIKNKILAKIDLNNTKFPETMRDILQEALLSPKSHALKIIGFNLPPREIGASSSSQPTLSAQICKVEGLIEEGVALQCGMMRNIGQQISVNQVQPVSSGSSSSQVGPALNNFGVFGSGSSANMQAVNSNSSSSSTTTSPPIKTQ
ncbi:MAG: hypothetical protein WCW01_04940 [Gammaproteobacteria bacterium]